MNEIYYVFAMGPDKRYKAKVFTATEAKKLKGDVVLCGATFYLKKHEYGTLYCKPVDYGSWELWAKTHNGKIIEWEGAILKAPNGNIIARKALEAKADGSATPLRSPTVVCLCGSTRFSEAFQQANFNETLAGRIVLTIGCDMKSDNELFKDKSEGELEEIKTKLDRLHFQKIDLADEVLILNVGGYIGESTKRELAYAESLGKRVRYLEGGDDV